jgi:hypothetical protein
MKKIKLYTFLAAILMNLTAFGQVTVTGTAYTEIVPLATIIETIQLNTGRFSVLENGGSITITPQGSRLAKGSVILLDGPFSQASFTVKGSDNNSLSVLLPTTPQLLFHTNSVNTIYLDKWTYDIPRLSNGFVIVNVGATLNFKSLDSNPTGLYTGRYQIIFFYN